LDDADVDTSIGGSSRELFNRGRFFAEPFDFIPFTVPVPLLPKDNDGGGLLLIGISIISAMF
jgi:hypothetical protein